MESARLLKLVACFAAIFLPSLLVEGGRLLSNAGTQFVVGGYSTDNALRLDRAKLYVTTPENNFVNFSISDGTTVLRHCVKPAGHVAVDLKSTFGNNNNGILISSDDGVSKLIVVAERSVFDGVSGDTFTLFPVQDYGSYTYFAVSVENKIVPHTEQSFVHIVGTANGTSVTITPTQALSSLAEFGCSGAKGEDCSLSLDRLQTLILRSPSDLTGTKIVSDRPISVFTGHECAVVPVALTSNCKPLVEQIPPVVTWGRSFLVGPLLGHVNGEWYKIISAKEQTKVNVYCTGSGKSFSKSIELPTEGSADFFPVGDTRRCIITGDKPLLVVLFAANEDPSTEANAFMALVPPVKQYISSVTLTLEPASENNTVSVTIPATSCPASLCSLLVDDDVTVDLSTSSQPVSCSQTEICGYVLSLKLSSGVHTLRLSGTGGPIGVVSYTDTSLHYGFGTVGGLALNHIAVDRPVVEVGYDGPLVAGQKLVLTCRVVFHRVLDDEIKLFPRLLRGEESRELKTPPPFDLLGNTMGCYFVNYTFEVLSLEDSDVYSCEVTVRSDNAGVLATASDSMSISVVGYGYIQLQLSGVAKCSEWLTESEERVRTLAEEVASIIAKGCDCDFSSMYISMPTLQCASVNPDIVLFQARVQEGRGSPVNYHRLVTILESAKGTSFRFKAILLTIGSSSNGGCGVAIEGFQASPDCFTEGDSPADAPPTSGDVKDDSGNESGIIVASVVATSVVVIVLGLAGLIMVGVAKSRRHGVSTQRPKSIHLHHRLPHGGDSVTSFSPPGSGSPNSNIYVEKEPAPSSPTSKSSFPISQNGTHSPPADEQEQEQNYKTMKVNISELELLPISHV